MLNPIVRKFQYGTHTVTLETGVMARQATSAVMASMNDTSVFVTVVGNKFIQTEQKFFPLTVNYQERSYAAGKIPGSFFRREGRPSENEILIARLIDRPIRPLFPKNFKNEIQIIATVVSLNPEVSPDIISMIGASAALSLSGIPFKGPTGAARIGYINKNYILNPSTSEMKKSKLDLVISGTNTSILMVEAEAKVLTEEEILNSIIFGHEQQQIVIHHIKSLVEEAGQKNWEWFPTSVNPVLKLRISELSEKKINKAYKIINKKKRQETLIEIKNSTIQTILSENKCLNEYEIANIIYDIEKSTVSNRLFNYGIRIDGREKDMIRSLDIRTGILPRTHGSALFTRGETQSLVTTTLGISRDAQNVDEILGEKIDYFLFHYNFAPYSVGEIGIVGSPKRREIGHGKLAKKSMLSVMPNIEDFPYTIRIVSEITESNGSSSMASVCGASLSLMDAGVPIKESVAGIAMGLFKEGNEYIILSDILGDEDYLGDMDFKVAGTRKGITSLQMDIKIEGVNINIIKLTLNQSHGARLHILNIMEQAINKPRRNISEFAPRIHVMKINPEKIKDVIGKGGSVIRMLTEETGTSIEIEDNGIIKISSTIAQKVLHAIKRIEEITTDIEIGKIYPGKITRIVDFGAFVCIGIGKEGLVHISQISNTRVEKVSDFLKINQKVLVKVLEIDRQGRLRLSLKNSIL
ncbi:polyribonucleotide nucleotidyltransferase [Buchnera aphidicola (Taiwanaphis decaspermi)]|uniref:polyribonucleotide nucleotidyltransferase n=1 Tax=Buchnera aphidicola TaxID=9 RepID=UPI0031B8ACEF